MIIIIMEIRINKRMINRNQNISNNKIKASNKLYQNY